VAADLDRGAVIVERVGEALRLARVDGDGAFVVGVVAHLVAHLLLVLRLFPGVADEGIVGHLAGVLEAEGDGLTLLHLDGIGLEGDVDHVDVDRA
jgi:uncharacterized membrane protein YhhN